jgi:hypothetical protein
LIKDIDIAIINFRNKIRFALISKKQYVTHRARNAYVASICQFETSFDLSLVAQSIEISSKNITILKKRLQWQIDNHFRYINYVKLDSTKFRLMILQIRLSKIIVICCHKLIMLYVWQIQNMLTSFINRWSNVNA